MLFSEPKIPQSYDWVERCVLYRSFSALQRAENSSIKRSILRIFYQPRFQCSSASRKFLNRTRRAAYRAVRKFQCSSASRKFLNFYDPVQSLKHLLHVSVLFSEPKIPQYVTIVVTRRAEEVSVLFSEPKIPQLQYVVGGGLGNPMFQCSSASRKFLKRGAGTY